MVNLGTYLLSLELEVGSSLMQLSPLPVGTVLTSVSVIIELHCRTLSWCCRELPGGVGETQGFPGCSVVKNLHANAGNTDLIPTLGRSSEGGNGNHSSIPAWIIPWTEEPSGLQSMGCKESGKT